jgi:hypothetical protein
MGPHRTQILILALALCTLPALAQQPGWSYSPLPGEGDRAALGCGRESSSDAFACLAVRCEDDFSTGIHIHTSRAQGDAGRWAITIDKETRWFDADLANGAVAYLQPEDGSPMPDNHIALDGSLYAINRALAFCAPRVPRRAEPLADPGV